MNIPRFTYAFAIAGALAGCGQPPVASTTQSNTPTNTEQEKVRRMVAEAEQWERDAQVIIDMNGYRGDDMFQIVRPTRAGTAPTVVSLTELDSVVRNSVQQRSVAVVRLPEMVFHWPAVTNIVTRLKGYGFTTVHVVVLRWGKIFPGPEI